jgi:hypothetical protein
LPVKLRLKPTSETRESLSGESSLRTLTQITLPGTGVTY